MPNERRVRIVTDQDAFDPREDMYDCFARMVCWHSRYKIGDPHEYADPDRFRACVDFDECVALPIFMYDHSGITIRTTPFDCPWDSGQIGWIYCDAERLREDFAGDRDRAEESLRTDVAVYDAYLRGAVYGFIVEERDGDDWEHVDSCWGFYGDDIHENGIADHLGDDELIALAECADIE